MQKNSRLGLGHLDVTVTLIYNTLSTINSLSYHTKVRLDSINTPDKIFLQHGASP